jgi:2-oxoglutarate ferredoxin oxidoreductase subunit delta
MSLRNVVLLDAERCNACGICVKTCPELVFEQPEKLGEVTIAHPARCVGCLSCEEDCTQHAIVVHRLPAGLNAGEVPEPAAGIDADRVYDLLVVGAGPAGLGAAIRGRALGLSVAVVERLPSHRRAHHPDGGLLFAAPDIYAMKRGGDGGLHLAELDLTIPAELVREWLQDFALIGPEGKRTRSTKRRWDGFPVVDKDGLVELFADRARADGAQLYYNTRVAEIVAPRGDQPGRLELVGGAALRGRLVISAEGTSGRLAEAAGIDVNAEAVGWSYALEAALPATARAPQNEFAFVVGPVEGQPAQPAQPFLGYWCSGSVATHVGFGTLQQRKRRVVERPLSAILRAVLREDERYARGVGRDVVLPEQLDGCRVLARRLPKAAVAHGVIAVGDAIATCGMATTLVAMKTGDLAAEVGAAALARGDVSARGLAAFEKRVFKLSMLKGMSWMHKLLIEAPLRLTEDQLGELFELLERLTLTRLMAGGAGAVAALLGFYGRNAIAMLRKPALRDYLRP